MVKATALPNQILIIRQAQLSINSGEGAQLDEDSSRPWEDPYHTHDTRDPSSKSSRQPDL